MKLQGIVAVDWDVLGEGKMTRRQRVYDRSVTLDGDGDGWSQDSVVLLCLFGSLLTHSGLRCGLGPRWGIARECERSRGVWRVGNEKRRPSRIIR